MLKATPLIYVAALVASILIPSLAASQPPIPSHGKVGGNQQSQAASSGDKTQADKRGTEEAPLVVKVRTTTDADKEAADEAEYAMQEATDNRYLLLFTAILAGAALLQWGVMVWQSILLNRTANAAKASADAVVSQLRAYLSMRVKEGIPPTFDAVAGPYFAFEIRNTGQTPAFRMDYWIRGGIGPVDSEGPFPGPEEDVPPHLFTLAPGSSTDVSTSGPEPEAGVAAAFANGQVAAYAWGEINYIDAFRNERFHRFRYTFTAHDIAGPLVHIRLCRDGNEAN